MNNGHRWTNEELKQLIGMWLAGSEIDEIAEAFGTSRHAINKQIGRMRREGIPMPRRQAGNRAGRRMKPWTQSEVEYVIRRRNDKISAEQIAEELDRTFLGVQALIQKLRKEDVPIRMLGSGKRRLWDVSALKAACVGRSLYLVDDKAA